MCVWRWMKMMGRRLFSRKFNRKYRLTRRRGAKSCTRNAIIAASIRRSIRLLNVLRVERSRAVHPLEPILAFCTTHEDVHFLRENREYLGRFSENKQQTDVILEDLQFFVEKCIRLEAAEKRLRRHPPNTNGRAAGAARPSRKLMLLCNNEAATCRMTGRATRLQCKRGPERNEAKIRQRQMSLFCSDGRPKIGGSTGCRMRRRNPKLERRSSNIGQVEAS